MTEIVDLWRAGRLPIEDAIHFADGRSFTVDVVDNGLVVLEEFELAALLVEDPDRVTSIDITRRVPAPSGFVVAGEGSYGSDGFVARLAADEDLVWVFALSEANPFDQIDVGPRTAAVTSTSGLTITVELDAPVG